MPILTRLCFALTGLFLLCSTILFSQENGGNFGRTVAKNFDLTGKIYGIKRTLPPYSLPEFFEPDSLLGVIYTNKLDVPPRQFDEGFPGLTNKYTWFAIDYQGTFGLSEAAVYRFKLKSDDGSRLYIDGKEVIDNDGMHKPKEKTGSIFLEKGIHDIRVKYFQGFPNMLCLQLWMAKGEGPFGVFDTEEIPADTSALQPARMVFNLSDTLLFATDSYRLSPGGEPVLEAMIPRLSDTSRYKKIEIIGHTDDVGREEYNIQLSVNRAKVVKEFFVKKGIDPARIEATGKGETAPLAPNNSPANRAKNRRVEIVVH